MAVSELAKQKCVPCKGGVAPLQGAELKQLQTKLGGDWKVVMEHHLEKEFAFDDFKQALEFTNRIGEVAEEQGHHPDIFLQYGKVTVSLYTHKIDGLSESDFILAAKIDESRERTQRFSRAA